MKSIHIIYAFTSFSVVQLISYLGTAYTQLFNPMLILILLLLALQIAHMFINWAIAQSKTNNELSTSQILSAVAMPVVVFVFILIAVFVGSWIAS